MGISVDTPVQFLKGVGPRLGEVLHKRGISTVEDLLHWFPRTYEDRRAARSIGSLAPEQVVSLAAEVVGVRSMTLGRSKRRMYEIIVADKSGRIACKFFRVPYKGYFERFQPQDKVRVAGKVTEYRGRMEFHHPDVHHLREDEETADTLIPLYTETEGLSPAKLRKIIDTALSGIFSPELTTPAKPAGQSPYSQSKSPGRGQFAPKPDRQLVEPLPAWVCQQYQLPQLPQALREIHQPPPQTADLFLKFQAPAQRRVIFEEFFWLELLLAQRRAGVEREQAPSLKGQQELVHRLIASLEFQLTGAQKKAWAEVVQDVAKPHPMHRLVQGDVGSGKTMVALLAAVYAAENGYQTSLMVPTEILAEQHFQNAQRRLSPLGVRVALLTGQMKPSERQEVYQRLESGEIQLVIGTHALIQAEVKFKNLALVIIDEQHRFGVGQRLSLKEKGLSPHFLVMTATPIPRSLAMTVYGDLDVSIIDELPAGRQQITTRVTYQSKHPQVWDFVEKQILSGRQAYVVYPLVEESEKIDLKNAVEEFDKLKGRFPKFRLGLLHGRMKPVEKEAVMTQFRQGELDILVSTTVIEVGVDVPNANVMVIEHAERFGLSQLHQLRGRVGRGAFKSYCVLVLGYAVSEESRQRAEIMEKTADGFRIAEADLELRGPGEFLGTRQSGLPGFKMANLVRDLGILQQARQAAFKMIADDPQMNHPENQRVWQLLAAKQSAVVG